MSEESPTIPEPSVEACPVQPPQVQEHTDWGPPSAGRYFAAFLILIGITAIGSAVIWVLWGKQLWSTFTTY